MTGTPANSPSRATFVGTCFCKLQLTEALAIINGRLQNDALFLANQAGTDISVSGLAQANRNRPLEPLLILMQQVMDTVADLPHRKLRALDKRTWQGIVQLLQRTDLFDATTLILPPKLRKWAPGKHEDHAAMKLQLRIDGWRGDFKKIMLTPEPGADSPYLSDLLGNLEEQEDQIFIFDGGYWKIATYHAIVREWQRLRHQTGWEDQAACD